MASQTRVSKSEAWQGIEYVIGAAYIIDPDPDSEDARELAGFKLLEELGLRARDEDLARNRKLQRRLSGDANHVVFSNRRVISEALIYSPRNRRFFEHVLDSDDYPSVPPENPALVEALDRISFKAFLQDPKLQQKLYGRSVGAISSLGWEAIEYCCWGAFGTRRTRRPRITVSISCRGIRRRSRVSGRQRVHCEAAHRAHPP